MKNKRICDLKKKMNYEYVNNTGFINHANNSLNKMLSIQQYF